MYGAVEAYAQQAGSLYRDIRRCRDDLLDFMDANGWFGQKVCGKGDKIYLSCMEPVLPRLELWLRAYGRPDEEKITLLVEHFSERFPATCGLYRDFMEQGEASPSGYLRTLDYILSSIDGEIVTYGDDKIQCLIASAEGCLGAGHTGLLIRFLNELKKNGLHMAWSYRTVDKKGAQKKNGAFTLDEFSRMAYCTFSPEAWESQSLVKKAAASGKCAKLWLFVALHFVCALRKADMERLPAPVLYGDREVMRKSILEDTFSETDAQAIADGWIFLIDTLALTPGKTAGYGGVPALKIFIPGSLKREFGIILTLAALRHSAGEPFVSSYAERSLIETFFGADFADASGTRYFRTRQANKAFLQGIEATAGEKAGKPKGYMLASLARSHKGGIGTLSKITDIYLKDENFTGYKPEFILKEMFDRGIFGFIPVLLLENYAGTQYRQLGVSGQTKLIREIGLTPFQIEELTGCIRQSMGQAELVVQSLLTKQPGSRLGNALQLIATGCAPAKEPELCCARLAMGYRCNAPDRSSCIGCGYEVYTKSALQLLLKEYRGLLLKKQKADGFESERISCILKKGVLPAITEIAASLPLLYPDADMGPLEAMLERGLRYAAIGKN